jgi:EAL domain-containing protein (putative c-di-GMP-specific phosphodiesterase class I)
MSNAEVALGILNRLDALGVALAIDDFGTGYSSLSYLKRFPVDILKIDRSFVDGLPADSDDFAIVSTIITLAQSLGMTVTAEGIETEHQADALIALGCGRGQGWLYSRAIPAAEIDALLMKLPVPS